MDFNQWNPDRWHAEYQLITNNNYMILSDRKVISILEYLFKELLYIVEES